VSQSEQFSKHQNIIQQNCKPVLTQGFQPVSYGAIVGHDAFSNGPYSLAWIRMKAWWDFW